MQKSTIGSQNQELNKNTPTHQRFRDSAAMPYFDMALQLNLCLTNSLSLLSDIDRPKTMGDRH